jgi:hypothetical protein
MERVMMMDGGDGIRRADNGAWGKAPTAKTANYTVKAADTGTVFSNKAAAGSVTFTLPAPVPGLWLTFLKSAAQNILLQATGGAAVGGSAANKVYKNVTNGDAGAGSVTLVCGGTNWHVIGSFGTWVVDNA